MARVFRQTYSKALPVDAEVFTRKGKRYARFRDGKGKVTTAPLSQDGTKIIREARKWYIEYKDADGCMKRVAGYTDKKATEQEAAELEREAEQVRSGYKPKEHGELKRPLSEHVEDFGRFLKSKDNGKNYVVQTVRRIERVFETCGFRFWGDIAVGEIADCLATLTHRGKRLSSQTREYYSQSIRQFCQWMVRNGRAGASPVEHLPSVKVVPTFERRAGTSEELGRLLATVADSGPRFGLTGNQRATLYRFAAETGLRAKEIRSLRVANLDFDACMLMVVAGYTKNKDRCEIPLKQQTADMLRNFMAGKLAGAAAFLLPSKYNMARMLKADLVEAGIPYVDELGRKFDFHALRHTFITSLRNAPARVAQSLARHKSSRMTDRYTHIRLHDERAAVEQIIPDYSIPDRPSEARATGTDNLPVDSGLGDKLSNKPGGKCSQVVSTHALVKPDNEFLIRRS